ncbi:MAG: hypothetical protein AAFU79_14465 [Myxococcota bacterium]
MARLDRVDTRRRTKAPFMARAVRTLLLASFTILGFVAVLTVSTLCSLSE